MRQQMGGSAAMLGPGVLLGLLLCSAFLPGAAAAAQLKTTSANCSVSMAPQGLALPNCPASNKTLARAREIAWKFAPIVHWHPLEPWTLQVRGNTALPCAAPLGAVQLQRLRALLAAPNHLQN